ncbi:MAG: hypothetical protein BJ554DRAFT_5370 [Olpidium bornovanus]|uniref:Uncharacterized protein n=1 Tax=Olpidium bornovanus TaxID=278681 RepID=A0A8H8A2D8_9FUNG|nr:MAG: hypothetical protein BJ554DRAFT_5370 [Olpidium bornovanus]
MQSLELPMQLCTLGAAAAVMLRHAEGLLGRLIMRAHLIINLILEASGNLSGMNDDLVTGSDDVGQKQAVVRDTRGKSRNAMSVGCSHAYIVRAVSTGG